MVQNFKTPVSKIVIYHLNKDSNYYELHTQPPGFNRLPNELKVEDTQEPRIRKVANQIIQGRQHNGTRTFFTGMRETPVKQTFFGDDGYTRPNKKSFVLFQFNNDCTRLKVHYFPGFIPLKPMREQFIQMYMRTV